MSETNLPKEGAAKPTPEGWPRISSVLMYEDAAAAIDWICRVFGFEVRMKIEGDGGQIVHSELTLGDDGLIMVADVAVKSGGPSPVPGKSPRELNGANTQLLCVVVDDADAHCERARSMGAKIIDEPATHDYGEDYWADRTYRAEDLEGHHWWFMQRVR